MGDLTMRRALGRIAMVLTVAAGIVLVGGGTASARHDICDHEFGACFRDCGTQKDRCSSSCAPPEKATPAQQHCVENCQLQFNSCEKKCTAKRKACEHH
jgi:hypothetical protein